MKIYLFGLTIPINACNQIIPYRPIPILWWLLLKALLNFLIDMTPPAVTSNTESICEHKKVKIM